MCYVESKHKIGAIHEHDGKTASIGVCQIKMETARSLGFKGTREQLVAPGVNVQFAGKLLSYQIARCRSEQKGIRAYNSGACHKGNDNYVELVRLSMLERR